jgi:eukaryotic-like serine/threonine-protein kinase
VPTALPPDSLVGQIIADRYRVLSLIGEGGMGRVYLAEHVHMGRKSAVKVLSPALAFSAEAISRFHREAANASRINHPNVAAIYDFGEASEGVMYLAMEYVEGETLTMMLQREGRLEVTRAAQLTKQAADALASAHHLGIVHRDLKPDNIMVARNMEGGDLVKVVDFGIAKSMGPSSQTVTTAGISIGTPEYMSPEQLAGEKLDARTDVYSLAVVLFHVLTGVLPYPQVTSRETLVKRLTSPPRKLGEVAADVEWPAELQRALDRALAPDVDDRYSSVGDFGRDVLAAAEHFAPRPAARLTSEQRPASAPTRRLAPSEPVAESPIRALSKRRFDRRLIIVGAMVVVAAWVAALVYRASVDRPPATLARPHAKSTSRR